MTALPRRRLVIGATFLTLTLVIGFAGYAALRKAEDVVRETILTALGPYATVDRMHLSFSGIALHNLRFGHPHMPAADVLIARQVQMKTDLSDLFLGRLTFSRVRIDGARLTLMRDSQGWQFPLPNPSSPGQILGQADTANAPSVAPVGPKPNIRIQRLEIADATLELVDTVVARPPHHLRLDDLNLTLHPIRLPELDGQTSFTLTATIPDARENGTVSLSGVFALRSREIGLQLRLRNADLGIAQPYLAGQRLPFSGGKGELDLEIDCRQYRLYAPGSLTLSGLELGGSDFNRLTPAQRLLAQKALRELQGKVSVRFTAEGHCSAPRFKAENSPHARLAQKLFRTLDFGITLLSLPPSQASRR